jgi:hypothetical protein
MMGPEYHLVEDYEIIDRMESTGEKMKIIHTTHDTAPGRSTCRPNSATQRIKDCFSIQIHSPSNPKEEDEERLVQPDPTIRQCRASETQASDGPGICANFMKEYKKLKRKQREKKMYEASKFRMERANEKAYAQVNREKSGRKLAKAGKAGYRQLQEVSSQTEVKRNPTLRRVKSFGDFKEAKTEAGTKAKAQGDERLNRMRSQRQAISDGDLEKVIPPPSSPRPKLTPKRQDASPNKTAHKKSVSTSSKLTSYMGTSADLLDATRRDLTSNLRKSAEKAEKVLSSKFDQFGRYSSGHGNNWDNESDSDESFYCIGERRLSVLDKARRISGDGTDSWTDAPQEECRLCRKPSPAGVRGLCRECENEFRRPKTTVLVDDEDEVKPPPPLKIKKTKTASAHAQVMTGNIHHPCFDENVLTSKINQVDKKPQIVTPGNHISQQVYIDDGYYTSQSGTEYMSRYERWQSPDLRDRYQNRENENSRWSPRLLDDQTSIPLPSLRSRFNKVRRSSAVDEDTTPLVAGSDRQSHNTRNNKGTKNGSF